MIFRPWCLGLVLLAPLPALAQVPSSEIDAVFSAQQQQEEQYRSAQADQREREQRDRQVQARHSQAQADARLARENERVASARASQQRDQSYQDQLRALAIQRQVLDLQAVKTRVARENDYIDRDLAKKGAETDVTESEAIATRNLSMGARTLLERTGEAEVDAAALGKTRDTAIDGVGSAHAR
ncbi:DUF5384 family protein [Lichenicoccus roseus]|uniref:Uncharacterized protein n=1 Tax=Lichenicoccus roseus TaxID=2683649 RepID=A0A5R9JC49_9PROT|nr:DUF5384 family protein [Lichenicoccus roseus]TLU73191.1 hypothetical protein FE263_07140 [Lichenicoccus roseus]